MPKPRKKESVVLGKLDKKTILVSSSNAFVLRERIKNKDGEYDWVSKYFYSEIGDAVRGYARHALRRASMAKRLDGSLGALITQIERMEAKIEKVGARLEHAWAQRQQDPIEACLSAKGQDT